MAIQYEDEAPKKSSSIAYEDEQAPPPSGAAFGVYPSQRATPSSPTTKERVKELIPAIGAGAALGAIAPEATQFTGKAMQLYAPTRALGYPIEAAGLAMKGRRGAEAGLGALGGGAADIAGQLAKEKGYGPVGQFVAQTGAGMAAPALLGLTAGGVRYGLGKLMPFGGQQSLPKAADFGIEATEPSRQRLIRQQTEQLRGRADLLDVPQNELFRALQAGAGDIQQAAEQQAAQVRQAGAAALSEAETRAGKMGAAAKRSPQLGAAEVEAARQARAQVGQEREVSDIGSAIRQKIDDLFGSQAAQRSQDYKQQMAVRDAVVAEKESAGQFVRDMPEYKSLIDDLRNKLLIGAVAQEQKTAPVTEPGVLRAYQNIYDAVTSRRVQVGVNEVGNPIYKTFPTSFQALDDVRRRLGDVAFGKDVEGYAAIGQKVAEKYYAKISELQSKYAGEAHDTLQGNYEMASRLLEKFKGKAGKKATALDRLDPERFMTDAASLPNSYFSSKQSVDDLIALSGGDRQFVVKQGSDLAARQLRDLNATGVKSWINRNSDWLNALPEVRTKVEIYQRGLERGERIAGKTQKAATILEPSQERVLREGQRAVTQAETTAGQITKEASGRVKTILGDANPSARIQEIILGGKPSVWLEVGPIIANQPRGKELIAAAVNQIMADRAESGLVTVVRAFDKDVAPSLKAAGLMNDRAINDLRQKLTQIRDTAINESAKLTMMQSAIKNALVGLTAQPVGSAAVSAYDVINRKNQIGSVATTPR